MEHIFQIKEISSMYQYVASCLNSYDREMLELYSALIWVNLCNAIIKKSLYNTLWNLSISNSCLNVCEVQQTHILMQAACP